MPRDFTRSRPRYGSERPCGHQFFKLNCDTCRAGLQELNEHRRANQQRIRDELAKGGDAA